MTFPKFILDIHSNDLGFVAIEENGKLVGFNVLVGGGLSSEHGNTKTYNKIITLTYTNYVEQKSGVQGEFFFYARVDHDVVRQEGDLNGGFTVGGRTLYPGIVHYNGPPKRYDSKIEKFGSIAPSDYFSSLGNLS